LLNLFDLDPLPPYIKTKPSVEAHVLVGDPDQGKAANQVSAPVIEKKFIARDEEKEDGYVVAEAVFASKYKEQLPAEQMRARLALSFAEFPRFTKDFFMRQRPRNAGNGKGQQSQPDDLNSEGHLLKRVGFTLAKLPLAGDLQCWLANAALLHHGPAAIFR